MKLSYRISLLFLVSISLFTFSNSYADSDMLSVTGRYNYFTSPHSIPGEGSHTITATDVFMAGGSSYGGSFHLYATFSPYPSDVYLYSAWRITVYVNDVQVLERGFSPDGSYAAYLDEYITAKEGDVVRIKVYPDQLVGGINSTTTTNTYVSYCDAIVHFGVV